MNATTASAQAAIGADRSRQSDEQRPAVQAGLPIGPMTLTLGGEVEFESELQRNFDLTRRLADDVLVTILSTELEGLLKISQHLELFGELKLSSRRFPIDQTGGQQSRDDYEMGETGVLVKDLFAGHVSLRLGRHDFDDAREWLYDQDLDAIRLFLHFAPVRMELAVLQQLLTKVEADEDDVINALAYVSYEVTKGAFIDAYMLVRRDFSRRIAANDGDDSHPTWFGLRSYGELFKKRVRYWFEAAYLTGRVSGRNRSKTYGKDCVAICGSTCPRIRLFGKDIDKSLRSFKGLRIIFSPVEPFFSGKLSHMTST